MFKILQRHSYRNKFRNINILSIRTFLSQSYYCQEVWDRRLNSPILQKVKPDEFYYELDQRYQKTRELSAVDVDIYANSVRDESYTDELLDIIHKLRLTSQTGNTLNSTSHAAVRYLLQHDSMENLINVLDDRLNYGVFIDYFIANVLMDICWKKGDYTSGARIASQLMLQEEWSHLISYNLALLHCYKYLLNPQGWPEYPKPEEPEEEVKVRVKFVRNPYFDDHFDLRDPDKLVGKTLAEFTKTKTDSVSLSFNILGNILFDKPDSVSSAITVCNNNNVVLYKEILDLVPADKKIKKTISDLKQESVNVEDILKENVQKAVQTASERDIAEQCKIFLKWEDERQKALEVQQERLSKIQRLKSIEDIQKYLAEKETRLWFFENEENIELAIEQKEQEEPVENKATTQATSEEYIPPEVQKRHTT